jgi:hypothetical protein
MPATNDSDEILEEAQKIADSYLARYEMEQGSTFQSDGDKLAFWFTTGRVHPSITKHGHKRLIDKFEEAWDNGNETAQDDIRTLHIVTTLMQKLLDEKYPKTEQGS